MKQSQTIKPPWAISVLISRKPFPENWGWECSAHSEPGDQCMSVPIRNTSQSCKPDTDKQSKWWAGVQSSRAEQCKVSKCYPPIAAAHDFYPLTLRKSHKHHTVMNQALLLLINKAAAVIIHLSFCCFKCPEVKNSLSHCLLWNAKTTGPLSKHILLEWRNWWNKKAPIFKYLFLTDWKLLYWRRKLLS